MAAISDVSVGWKTEVTYGTGVVVDRWMEFLDESLDYQREIKQGMGLRVGAGRIPRATRRVSPTKSGSGDLSLELYSKGMGTLLQHAMGTSVSTLVSGTTYQQNHSLINGLLPSLTIQKGLVMSDGTVAPYTFAGCVVSEFEINVPFQGIATMKTKFDIRSVATATGYTAPTYASGGVLFHWGDAAVTIGGTVTAATTTAIATGGTAVTNIRDFTLKVNNGIANDRFLMGAGGLKAKPVPGIASATGTITVEYSDAVMRDALLADTSLPIVLTITSTEALSTGFSTFQIYLAECRLDGVLPQANAGKLINTTYAFTVLDNSVATNPVMITTRTADTAL